MCNAVSRDTKESWPPPMKKTLDNKQTKIAMRKCLTFLIWYWKQIAYVAVILPFIGIVVLLGFFLFHEDSLKGIKYFISDVSFSRHTGISQQKYSLIIHIFLRSILKLNWKSFIDGHVSWQIPNDLCEIE